MPTAHLIDELIFDCSLDSTVIASNHESVLSAWVSDGLLPAIDGVLNEFDEAGALWCLDCVCVCVFLSSFFLLVELCWRTP